MYSPLPSLACILLKFTVEGKPIMQDQIECTLYDLLQGVNRVTDDDQEVAAAVTALINSGKVRLRGNFAGAKISVSDSLKRFPEQSWSTLLGIPAADL